MSNRIPDYGFTDFKWFPRECIESVKVKFLGLLSLTGIASTKSSFFRTTNIESESPTDFEHAYIGCKISVVTNKDFMIYKTQRRKLTFKNCSKSSGFYD